jgi:hypothetical protein
MAISWLETCIHATHRLPSGAPDREASRTPGVWTTRCFNNRNSSEAIELDARGPYLRARVLGARCWLKQFAGRFTEASQLVQQATDIQLALGLRMNQPKATRRWRRSSSSERTSARLSSVC